MKPLITILFISILTFVYAQKNENSNQKWVKYKSKAYSVNYPKNWELDKSGTLGLGFIIFSPVQNDDDRFRENVNFIEQNLAGMNIDMDEYVEISVGQVKTMLENGKLIESKRLNKKGKVYHKFIYSATQENYNLMFTQYVWIKNEKAYLITFTTEIDQYDYFRNTGEMIMNSFKLK